MWHPSESNDTSRSKRQPTLMIQPSRNISGGDGTSRKARYYRRCLQGNAALCWHREELQSDSSIRAVFGMLEPCDGKLSRTVLRGEGSRKAPDLPGSRHEVAFLYVISTSYNCRTVTRHVPAGILGRRAAVALMTGCEALPTMYRIGWKS